jgi:hypothetical protein
MRSGWGFVRSPIQDDRDPGLIKEIVRDGRPFSSKSKGLGFYGSNKSEKVATLEEGQLVSYQIKKTATDYAAIDVAILQDVPNADGIATRFGILTSVPKDDYGFVQTAEGMLFLHITRVTTTVRSLRPYLFSLYRVIFPSDTSAARGQKPEVLAALPVTSLDEGDVEELLGIPVPYPYHEGQPWSTRLLSYIYTLGLPEHLEVLLQVALMVKPALLLHVLPQIEGRWGSIFEAPESLLSILQTVSRESYGKQWSVSELTNPETLTRCIRSWLVAQAPPKEVLRSVQSCSSLEEMEWEYLASLLQQGNADLAVAVLIQAALGKREAVDRAQQATERLSELQKQLKEERAAREEAERREQAARQALQQQQVEIDCLNRELDVARRHARARPANYTRISVPGSRHSGPAPVWQRPDAPEADQIQEYVRQRGIKNLVHLTRIKNLLNICLARGILSVAQLKERGINFVPFDSARYDGYTRYVNCSISYYNFHMFSSLVNSREGLALLYIRPEYLWKKDTHFCPMNAATNSGKHVVAGFPALMALFGDVVEDKTGRQTRARKPEWLPTNIQAEVLVPNSIALEDVLEIVVRSGEAERAVRAAGWQGEVRIAINDFCYRDEWIARRREVEDDFDYDDVPF